MDKKQLLIEQVESIIEGEEWKYVQDTDERYIITESGRLFSLWLGNGKLPQWRNKVRELKHIYISQKKYSGSKIVRGGKSRMVYIHRLIAEVFLPNPKELPQVNHKDADIRNNHYSNLEWVTHQENTFHAYENGLYNSGEDHTKSKLTNKEAVIVRKIHKSGRMNITELADLYNVSNTLISKVVNNKTYKDI